MSVEFYDQVYRANPEKWTSPLRDEFAFAALSEFKEPETMLDFGCGNGHTIRYFMNHWHGTDFYGVDISSVALDISRKKTPGASFYNNLDGLSQFDLITMLGVLEHFENPSDIITVANHLSPAGLLYVEVPDCLSYSASKVEGFRKTTGGTGQTEWHLRRVSWELTFMANGLRAIKSLEGKQPAWRFIWILQRI